MAIRGNLSHPSPTFKKGKEERKYITSKVN